MSARRITQFGFRYEEARTNLALQSGSPALWTAGNATAVAAATTAPDGTLTGALLREDTINTVHVLTPGQTILTATQYVVSFFAKASTRTFFGINGAGLAAAGLSPSFNLSTGVDASTGINAAFFHGIVPCPDGWFRCWVRWTTTNTTAFNAEIHNPAAGNRNYLGDGASGLFIWGAQIEAGAYLTSYIPTTAAAAARGASQWYWPRPLGMAA